MKTLKIIVTILLTINSNFLKAQEIQLQLITIDSCEEGLIKIDTLKDYWIFKDNKYVDKIWKINDSLRNIAFSEAFSSEVNINDFDSTLNAQFNGIYSLPDTGEYYISFGYYIGEPNPNYDFKVHIIKQGLNIITVKNIKVGRAMLTIHDFPYYCCGRLCDGFNKDFYENGNLRVKGKFENGEVVDTVEEFYYSGMLKLREINTKLSENQYLEKTEYYLETGQLFKSYSKKTELISKEPLKANITYENDSLNKRTYFKKYLYEQGRRKVPIEIKKFDEAGEIILWQKNNFREIYTDGKVQKYFEWEINDRTKYDACKIDSFSDSCDELLYFIDYKEFAENNQIILEGKFKAEFRQIGSYTYEWFEGPSVDYEDFDWIISMKKYNEYGKLLYEIKDKEIYEIYEYE